MIGHPLGGSGAIEALACVQTIWSGIIHPTINYEVPNVAREADVRTAMSNSFGLGGQNACLVLTRYQE